jgi:hypothetical protein
MIIDQLRWCKNNERQDDRDELWADNFQEGQKFVLADLLKTQRPIVRVAFWRRIRSTWKGERLAKIGESSK